MDQLEVQNGLVPPCGRHRPFYPGVKLVSTRLSTINKHLIQQLEIEGSQNS